MASRVKGRARVRNLLRRLPDAIDDEVRNELNLAGRDLAAAMRGRAPIRTGATRAGISYRVLPKTLKLRVGLLGTPSGRAKLFYARIQDLGRKAQTVSARRHARGSAKLSTYTMNVRGMSGKHFVTGRFTELRQRLTRDLKGLWQRALERTANGAGSAD